MRCRRPGGLRGYLLAAALAVLTQARAGTGSGSDEFLIAERPARLAVLNRYQQNLTPGEQMVLQPFVPMKVLKTRDLLGDGFTSCARVEIGGAEYYLVREDRGRFAGEADAGAYRTYVGVSHPYDTVHVLKDRAVRFSAADAIGEGFLAAGERLVRIFTRAGQTYVKRSGNSHVYGWVSLEPATKGRLWSLSRPVRTAVTSAPARVRDSIQTALSRTNVLLANLFACFNARSQQHRLTPRWQMEAEGTVLRCTLADGSPERDFPESTRYLVREIENQVLGSDLSVIQSPGGIEIRPK